MTGAPGGIPDDDEAASAIRSLEPVFHRGLAGRPAAEIEAAVHPAYWEVGASGAVYTREFVIQTVAARPAVAEAWPVDDFRVERLDVTTWLATYTLWQGERRTRRATVWQLTDDGWQPRYHQGTVAP